MDLRRLAITGVAVKNNHLFVESFFYSTKPFGSNA